MGAVLAIDDAARRSQSVFRSVMIAMSHPGRIERLASQDVHAPLPGGMAAVAAALCDFETPVWLDAALNSAPVVDWFRFQTGAPLVDTPAQATFCFVADADSVPALDELALGTDAYPDRSATLIVAVERLSDEDGMRLCGPGVNGETRLDVGRLRDGLLAERAALRDIFPRGVDFIFVCGDRIAALPRTTLVEI